MHWFVPFLYSINLLLHVSALVCHHHGASWVRLRYLKYKSNGWYSGPSSYDRLDIRTTWVTTKNFSFDLRPKS
jgi:hypothetical protein